MAKALSSLALAQMVCCLGLLGRVDGLDSAARADSKGFVKCVADTSPCRTCGGGNTTQCLINLNGWVWGHCETMVKNKNECFQEEWDCGDEATCTVPPLPTGFSCPDLNPACNPN